MKLKQYEQIEMSQISVWTNTTKNERYEEIFCVNIDAELNDNNIILLCKHFDKILKEYCGEMQIYCSYPYYCQRHNDDKYKDFNTFSYIEEWLKQLNIKT